MARKRYRRSEVEIREILREWSASGLSQSAFARKRHIPAATLSGWLRRYGRPSEAPVLREVEIVGNVGDAGIVLEHPSGLRLILSDGISRPQLREILLAVGDYRRIGQRAPKTRQSRRRQCCLDPRPPRGRSVSES